MNEVSFGRRLRQLAGTRGDDPALSLYRPDGSKDTLTFAEFRGWTMSVAGRLLDLGVTKDTSVVVSVGNSLEHFVTCYAAWQVGCLVLPINHASVQREREQMIALLQRPFVVSDWPDASDLSTQALKELRSATPRADLEALPDVVAAPGKAVGSGGSTGVPKLIVDPNPLAKVPGRSMGPLGDAVGFHRTRTQLVPGALFHNMPFTWSAHGLFEGQHVIVLQQFDAELLLRVIELERVEFMTVVPTMMRRVAVAAGGPGAQLGPDLSSLQAVMHSGAPCPEPLKLRWIELVGAQVLYEAFGSTEGVGNAVIRGDEWLERRGSVGRPVDSELRILDADGVEVEPGVVGEMFWKSVSPTPTYFYLGGVEPRVTADGFTSLGDLGWVDVDGYLYSADRRADLILTGGVNVYPAEVEGVLLEHPLVEDVAVIPVIDPEWGHRVHAVIKLREPGELMPEELVQWCRARLSSFKIPKSFEFISSLPRDEAGKLRRGALAQTRKPVSDSTPLD